VRELDAVNECDIVIVREVDAPSLDGDREAVTDADMSSTLRDSDTDCERVKERELDRGVPESSRLGVTESLDVGVVSRDGVADASGVADDVNEFDIVKSSVTDGRERVLLRDADAVLVGCDAVASRVGEFQVAVTDCESVRGTVALVVTDAVGCSGVTLLDTEPEDDLPGDSVKDRDLLRDRDGESRECDGLRSVVCEGDCDTEKDDEADFGNGELDRDNEGVPGEGVSDTDDDLESETAETVRI
jgi:hypothetical protein